MLELIIREPETQHRQTPLLFVHGVMHGAWCYDEFYLPYFAQQGYVSAAVSLRGHGNSPATTPPLTTRLHHYMDDIRHAAQQLQHQYGRYPVIIGHSMGGYTLQHYLRHYDDTPAVILLASAPLHGLIFETVAFTLKYPTTALQIVIMQDMKPITQSIVTTRRAFFPMNPEAMPDDVVEAYRQRMNGEPFSIYLELLFNWPRPKQAHKPPMLVVAGGRDTLFALWEQRRLAQAYHADFIIIRESAHDIMLDPAWQQSADAILAWLGAQPL